MDTTGASSEPGGSGGGGGGGEGSSSQPPPRHGGSEALGGSSSSTSPAIVIGGTQEPTATTGAGTTAATQQPSRYESQKRRDWNTFLQYLKNHKPPLSLSRCSGAHVTEFLKYLDQFGKTKVHLTGCPYFGHANPPALCACPLKQAWGSLDALIGRLRAAYEENGGRPEQNPFGARAVRIYLREIRESQAKARGIPYEKKKRKRPTSTTTISTSAAPDTVALAPPLPADVAEAGGSSASGGGGGGRGTSTTGVGPPTTTA